jgi:hypothetical protein
MSLSLSQCRMHMHGKCGTHFEYILAQRNNTAHACVRQEDSFQEDGFISRKVIYSNLSSTQ